MNKPISILVIEDNYGDFILLKKKLELTNIQIVEIVCAQKFFEIKNIIQDHSFDLVFLDLSLPDSKGIDSYISLSKILPKLPVIILSGMADMEVALHSISLGAQDYLMKGDFDEKLLDKTIHYSIERKRILEKLLESNERYKMVNQATNDVIWEWDFTSNSGLWGSGLMKNFGYSNEHLLKTKDWTNQYLHPDDMDKVEKKIAFTIENRIENWEEEYRFRCVDGTYKSIFGRGFITYNTDNTPYRMYGAMTDITSRKKLEKALAEQKLFQQKIITETTIDAQENERGMLGRELHDNINQILAAARMYIGMAKANKGDIFDLMNESHKLVDNAMEEIRKLSKTLVAPSLGDIGLEEALSELIEELNYTGQTHIILVFECERKIDQKIELMLYRIVQEQLNNISKYARAKDVDILLRLEENNLFLAITDNGVGFNPSAKAHGIGLKNIKSRVEFYSGHLEIISSPGKGCTLKIEVPL